jgi:hypothetical protein
MSPELLLKPREIFVSHNRYISELLITLKNLKIDSAVEKNDSAVSIALRSFEMLFVLSPFFHHYSAVSMSEVGIANFFSSPLIANPLIFF